MQQPEPCLDIPEDEELVDAKPVAAKPPKVCSVKFYILSCGFQSKDIRGKSKD